MSLLIPGAGFIKAIMAIKDLIVFFVESAIMLIPAITEAILALAAGSVAGVAKAIEFGLSKLIVLVINLFAKLIGLGVLSEKVMVIFSKIRKRVDKVVMKLLNKANKAKKAGRKLMQKLGIGAKEKPKNKQQHDEQVKAGLTYLKQQSKAEDKDNNKAITEEEAQKAATKTRKKFPVFTSITPRIAGGKWVYDWKGSNGTKKTIEDMNEDWEASWKTKQAEVSEKMQKFVPRFKDLDPNTVEIRIRESIASGVNIRLQKNAEKTVKQDQEAVRKLNLDESRGIL